MSVKMYLFLGQCIIVWSQLRFVNSQPLYGEKVTGARSNEFPALVALMHNYNRVQRVTDFICTGTLITREHVLTASHCLEDIQLNLTTVLVGSRKLTTGRKYFPAWAVDYYRWATNRLMRRPQYRVDDILIIKLAVPVRSNIAIATLATVPKATAYGSEIVAAGWGDTMAGGTPDFLQKVTLTVLSNEDCSNRLSNIMGERWPMPERFMCTYAEPLALMHYGDSGCPIFFNNEIIAIHKSTIPFPDQPVHPLKINVHSAIEYYTNFITDVITRNVDW